MAMDPANVRQMSGTNPCRAMVVYANSGSRVDKGASHKAPTIELCAVRTFIEITMPTWKNAAKYRKMRCALREGCRLGNTMQPLGGGRFTECVPAATLSFNIHMWPEPIA